MSKLEKNMVSIIVVSLLIAIAVYFFLDRKYSAEPIIEDTTPLALVSDPSESVDPTVKEVSIEEKSFTMRKVAYTTPDITSYFGARSKEIRLILAKLNGGGVETENAVEMGLAYLAKQQSEDGSWSPLKSPIGSTGLVLNAFLGAGYHHKSGDYKEIIGKGLEFLLSKQAENGGMNAAGNYNYDNGIVGVTFCEAYAMSGDERFMYAAEKLLAFLAKGQNPKGGWWYTTWEEGDPKTHTCDTSVTGWIMMAFKSAKLVGLEYDHDVIEKYKKYAKWITNSAGQAPYWKNADGSIRKNPGYMSSMTASTLMCRLYMGADITSPFIKEGLALISIDMAQKNRPAWSDRANSMDSYLWYHGMQVAFLSTSACWKWWHEKVVPMLVKHQIKEGEERGNWKTEYFKWDSRSTVYATSMNILMLETYYRYYK